MEIEKGPSHTNPNTPGPLSELEEAIIVWNGLGIKTSTSPVSPHVGLTRDAVYEQDYTRAR
jgi:hypothetical protein